MGYFDWSLSNPGQLQLQLEEESANYGDLIIGHYKDVSRLHTIAAMRWASSACHNKSKAFLFLDDRSGVNVDQLRMFIRDLPEAEARKGYFGDVVEWSRVVGDTDVRPVPWIVHNTYVRSYAFLLGSKFVEDVSVGSAFLLGLERNNSIAIGLLALKLGYVAKTLPRIFHPYADVPKNVRPMIASFSNFPVYQFKGERINKTD